MLTPVRLIIPRRLVALSKAYCLSLSYLEQTWKSDEYIFLPGSIPIFFAWNHEEVWSKLISRKPMSYSTMTM